jgi:cellulose synthase/poly-beta-1,6-N-acetylglucosamine synthase-like glycosyltransferase
MDYLFWLSIIFIFYVYAGYPAVLLLLGKIINKKSKVNDINENLPFVSFIIAAHNEEKVIGNKLENCLALDYPHEKLEIIVVSDQSNDRTEEIVAGFASENIHLLKTERRLGKTGAQNLAVRQATGEILVFSDANALWEKGALKALVAPFAIPGVGYVCGRLRYVNTRDGIVGYSEGLYWRYEIFLRKLESATGSITAGNGAIYAVRANNYHYFANDESHDFEFPRHLNTRSLSAVYVEDAIAYEKTGSTTGDEFKRKTRMMARVWGSIFRHPGALNPFSNGIFYTWKFTSHRLMRYLATVLLCIAFASNIILFSTSTIYQVLLLVQTGFYSLALAGAIFQLKPKIFYIPFYFCLFNYASMVGMVKSLLGSTPAYWDKAESTRA